MQPEDDEHREAEILRARLLMSRGETREAVALLHRLERSGQPSLDIAELLDESTKTAAVTEEQDEKRRDWRYWLGLQTTSRRIGYFVAALLISAYALWTGNEAVQTGKRVGFAMIITTRIQSRGGSYPWTRPVYIDVIYSVTVLCAAIAAMAVIVWAGKGAAQWEELDAPDSHRRGRYL